MCDCYCVNMNGPDLRRIKCEMCCFTCESNDYLMKLVIRYNQYEPQFVVQCKHYGCGATYRNWKSFQQHCYRNHPRIRENEQ